MTRTFFHSFDPPSASPVAGATVELDVVDIEDAAIREVLQTPGASFGAWSILDALLMPTGAGTPFVFREPLGEAREVKVALSGLFGRFVARAYLERYLNLSIFAHLGNQSIILNRQRSIRVKKLAAGDLPDWIACASNLSSLTVAEAKGCHDPNGPAKALARAWAQAGRIDVTSRGRKVTVKRIAVATRWGMAINGPKEPCLAVKDPLDEGEPIGRDAKDALYIGLFRLHIANMIRQLGHANLAAALYQLTRQGITRDIRDALNSAQMLLDRSPISEIDKADKFGGLVGGIVTQGGPIVDVAVTHADQQRLARLKLRPVFVGIERDLLQAAIDANVEAVRYRLDRSVRPDEFARPDRAGGWIVPIGEARHFRGGT